MGGAAASAAVAARPLVDSHCHLDYLERDGEIEPVVVRALQAGVGTMVTICTRLSEFDRIEAIARRFPRVFCSVGVHPHEAAKEGQQTPDKLIELAARDKVVGIGETGLDYFYEHAPRDAQQVSFRAHIAAARETGLPLIVHARDADDDTVKSAYRKLVRENHPDALIAQGMPEEFVEVANEKLAMINAAYDKICAARGIK